MECPSCYLNIPKSMKYSIMQNICPQCGAALLSFSDKEELEEIQKLLHSSGLVKKLNQEEVYFLASFVLSDRRKIIEQYNPQEGLDPLREEIRREALQESDISYDEEEVRSVDGSLLESDPLGLGQEKLNKLKRSAISTEEFERKYGVNSKMPASGKKGNIRRVSSND